MPVSSTISAQRSAAARWARTRMDPRSVNFRALPIRFVRIWVTFAGSVVTSSSRGRTSARQLQALPLRRFGEVRLDLPQQRRQWTRSRSMLDLARLDLGDVEDVVDQPEQQLGVALDAIEALPLLRIQLALPAAQERAVKPRMTVIGVRSSCETEARNRSFRAEARWSSWAVRAMRLRCSSRSSFCSAMRRDCSLTRSLAEALARATARLGAMAARALSCAE